MVDQFNFKCPARIHSTLLALPCDENGNMLPPGSPPPPRHPADATPSNPWNPFDDRLAFQFADYHFTELHTSEA